MVGKTKAIAFEAIAPTKLNTLSISSTMIATPMAIEYNIPVYM